LTAAVLLVGTRRSYSEGLRGWKCSRVSGRRWRRTTARRGYGGVRLLGLLAAAEARIGHREGPGCV
jgi:hypothetical protein